jgi:hypothetical protein
MKYWTIHALHVLRDYRIMNVQTQSANVDITVITLGIRMNVVGVVNNLMRGILEIFTGRRKGCVP